jgi:hypothetical protein
LVDGVLFGHEDLPVKLRAPKEPGQLLAVPSLDQVGALLERNRHITDPIHFASLGKSLTELRQLARREVLAASQKYHREAGEPFPEVASERWILAGHQPELFHPGVWCKNFVLHQLAHQHSAVALNLVVDTDLAKPALIHVPTKGHLASVPFDRSSLEKPYEERPVEQEPTFADFPNRVSAMTTEWNFTPMLPSFWQEVMKQKQRTPLLGERFAAARRTVEREWGCTNYELPMSRVCQTEAFAWFACSILGRLLTFHDAYNQTVREYRREHDIHSRNHPVPDLAVDGEWFEAPFWGWHVGEGRRHKLFVRRGRDSWKLRIGGVPGPTLPATQPARTVEAWQSLEAQGVKIRSRALTTTMFARLFLADLFIHGIGGGIYDELTDRIIENYFAMPAPAFLIVSATLLLPLPRFPNATQDWRRSARTLRDLQYQAERFLALQNPTPEVEALIQEKQEWIRRGGTTHEERAERFQRIHDINARLRHWVPPEIERVREELGVRRQEIKWDAIATRRDYAFCLYPEEMLKAKYQTLVI